MSYIDELFSSESKKINWKTVDWRSEPAYEFRLSASTVIPIGQFSVPGFYVIVDKNTNHYYIGAGKNLRTRFSSHLSKINARAHGNPGISRLLTDASTELVMRFFPTDTSKTAFYRESLIIAAAFLNGDKQILNSIRSTGTPLPDEKVKKISASLSKSWRDTKVSKAHKAANNSINYRRLRSKIALRLNKDPEYLARRMAKIHDPSYRKASSDRLKTYWSDTDYVEKQLKSRRTEPYRTGAASRTKNAWADPVKGAKMRAALKAMYSDPVRMAAILQKRRENLKNKKQKPA
jgi:predicted GIY-YIG superfamily endonuclease